MSEASLSAAQSPAAVAQSPAAESSKSAATAEVEPEAAVEPEADVGDLFGDDDDDDQPPPPRRSRSLSTTPSASVPGSPTAHPLEYGEEEDTWEEGQEVVANVPLPTWPHLRPTDGKVWHMRLPNYVNIESRPFDPDYYRATLDDTSDQAPLEPIAAKSKMIGVRNTIRWRWVTGPDGNPVKQSNARMLRWSDGSVSLQLGSDFFDVAPSHGASLSRPSDPASTNAAGKAEPSSSSSGTGTADTTFLCVAAPSEQVLVAETSIAGQLSLVPTSMDSKTHRELVRHVGQQHVKHSRMKILDDIQDQEKVAELLLRAAPQRMAVQPTKSRSTRNRASGAGAGGGGGGRSGGGSRSKKRASSEDSATDVSDDYQRSSRRGQVRRADRAASGEYDEDDGFVVADSDEDVGAGLDDESEDEDEAAYGSSRKKTSKKSSSNKKKKSSSKRRKNHDDDDDDDEDEVEAAERRIEEAERERKRAKRGIEKSKSGGASSGGGGKGKVVTEEEEEDDAEGEVEDEDMDMDVESEDD